ncbi:MAG: lipoyl(octanoyl) transferase LipB [Pelagibacteraceae bacterium]|jgi:lipoyl(octanoyl) transferase|nr:lipoyl(octanoyl) transferase LipB [Pelagibacteraceae bacterium]MDP6710087.1 lipoyl(octanoyl) transferase LipB [Pelagibacteraceae bacterium]|tara:strand:- start:634 stop:1251 length:618 start_codon:yes stop_codon:yes gene_type:complete
MNIEVKNSIKPVDYIDSMKILEQRVKDVSLGKKKELLWVLEHNSVYTAGTSSNNKDLIDKNLHVIKTNRGGKYTHHSPGQKIIYFVLNLNNRKKDIRNLIDKIESCIIQILKEYNIESYNDSKNIGIWVNKEKKTKKIAAIGIRVKKWIAYHGFSLNVCNDLSKYKGIVPCGIKDKGITSLKEMGIKNYRNIETVIIRNFLNIFF